MKKTATLMFALGLSASTAMALGTSDLQRCASIPDDSERLRCYDGLSRSMGVPTASADGMEFTTRAKYGKWTLRSESGKDGGAPAVFAYTYSEKSLPSQPGGKPLLVARCHQGVTEFFIEMPHKEASEGEPHGLYATPAGQEAQEDKGLIVIGSDAPAIASRDAKARLTYGNGMTVDLYLHPSADGTAWFFPNPVSFINQVRRSAKVTVEGINSMPSGKMTFDLDGFSDALSPLRATCSW